MRFTWQFTGPPSFPTRQNRPNGISKTRGGMPLKPPPMTQGSEFSTSRREYASEKIWDWNGQRKPGPCSYGRGDIRGGSLYGRRGHGCTRPRPLVEEYRYRAKTTLLAGNSASERTASLHARAVGKSSLGTDGVAMSFKAPDRNVVNRRLQRARAGGCVAPKKKGAIANPNSTGGCC